MVVVVLLRLLVDIPQQTAPSAVVAATSAGVACRASSLPLRRVCVCVLGVVSLVSLAEAAARFWFQL